MANRYTFETTLEGYVNVGKPAGKYNNCCFSFRLPDEILERAEKDREELLAWAKTKVDNPKRVTTNVPKWDDDGLVKYSFGGDANNPFFPFIDTDGELLEDQVRNSIRKGTKVRLIVDQTPYTKPALGTTLKVRGAQVLELVSGAVSDSGDLSDDDVIAMFQKSAGFKQSAPSPRQTEEDSSEDSSYDF